MSEREVATIIQPCILCEEDMEVWHVLIDEEVSVERIVVTPLEHHCKGMKALMAERVRTPRW